MKNFRGLKTLGLIAAVIFSVGSQTAFGAEHSGWTFKPSVMYLIQNFDNSGSKTETTRTLLDLTLGYKLNSPLLLGATYDYEQISTTTSSTSKTTFNAYGPTVGLLTDNIYMLFSYFVAATGSVDSGANVANYSSGSGFQATLGYKFSLTSSVDVAPEFSYRSLAFTKVNSGSGEVTTDFKYTTFVPYVAFWFYF